jgi:hypothetical protein
MVKKQTMRKAHCGAFRTPPPGHLRWLKREQEKYQLAHSLVLFLKEVLVELSVKFHFKFLLSVVNIYAIFRGNTFHHKS